MTKIEFPTHPRKLAEVRLIGALFVCSI